MKSLKSLNNLRQKRDRGNLSVVFYRQFLMLHPKKSILPIKTQNLRRSCRHVTLFKPFCAENVIKILKRAQDERWALEF